MSIIYDKTWIIAVLATFSLALIVLFSCLWLKSRGRLKRFTMFMIVLISVNTAIFTFVPIAFMTHSTLWTRQIEIAQPHIVRALNNQCQITIEINADGFTADSGRLFWKEPLHGISCSFQKVSNQWGCDC